MSNNLRKLKRAFETQRQQRDAAEFKAFVKREGERLQFEREHPVTSGLVPFVEYKEPQWGYRR